MDGRKDLKFRLNKKKQVLFVGSFKSQSVSGHVGGQMFACRSLLESDLSDRIDWILIDTTASTNERRTLLERTVAGILRLVRFTYILLTRKIDSVLIFSSHGWSFREKGTMALIAKSLGQKVIFSPRSGLIKKDIIASRRFKLFLIKVFSKIDILLCQGESWKTYYDDLLINRKPEFAVIHNWIDLSKYTISLQQRSDDQPIQVLFMGWITSNKGIWDILELAEMLKDDRIHFWLAGGGDEYVALQAEIGNRDLSDYIKLLGWVAGREKEELLENADVFILPSYEEGYPNALIEAMASGLVVLTTQVGSIPDLVIDNFNGFLVKPGDVPAMLSRIKTLQTDPSLFETLGRRARNSVLQQNSISNAIRRFEEVLL